MVKIKKLIMLIIIAIFTLLSFGCGSSPEPKTLVKALTTHDDIGQYIKFLETKVENDEIYCRIQNISEYCLKDITYKAYLLDPEGKRINDVDIYFPIINPNYVEETTTTIFRPVSEWCGKIETEYFCGFIHDPSK